MVPIDVSNIKLLGDASNPVNEVVRAAIGDLSQYWDNQMPRVFDRKFEPLAGGFYAWTPQTKLPPCAAGPEEISGNAFYCARGDLLAWDAAELLPQMQETYGDLAVGVVIAHEWGHVVQARENKVAATVTLEQQADCYAGAWMRHVEDTKNPAFPLSDNSADRALSGLLDVADQPGTAAGDPRAHGSGFDRVASFQSGYESGVKQCASMTDANTKLVELPFNGVRDLASGGNLPYNQIVDLAMSDLNDYFNVTGAKALGTTWKPIVARPFAAQAGAPTCGSSDTTKFKLFFCSPERYVAFDNTDLFPRLSERVGDYAVATMLATQFGLAVLTDANKMPKDTRKQNLAGDCVAGAWAADVFENRRTGNDNMRLSPGDLDEAIKVLLMFGKGSNSDYGSGFQRVEWYRKGVNGGITACTE
jgi:predicted metalloprotease